MGCACRWDRLDWARLHWRVTGLMTLKKEQVEIAKKLLDDGCSYMEAARTAGCHPRTLARRFPGRGWSLSESAIWGRYLDRMAVEDKHGRRSQSG
ncbi:helix-turn-helix DNA binding domain protein [Gordonia phage Mareelih]|nr:helix-turn-helix DNA binding domain protein [Gordonia phage Mareelih]